VPPIPTGEAGFIDFDNKTNFDRPVG